MTKNTTRTVIALVVGVYVLVLPALALIPVIRGDPPNAYLELIKTVSLAASPFWASVAGFYFGRTQTAQQ